MSNISLRVRTIILASLVLFCGFSFAEIRVGVISSTSGPTAEYGVAIANGIQLAKNEHPQAKDNLKFIFEDASYDPLLAVRAFQKLTNIDKVDLIYVWGVSFCKAVAPLAKTKQIPFIGQCIDYLSVIDNPLALRFMNHKFHYAETMSQVLKAKGLSKIALIITDNSYLEEQGSAYLKYWSPEEIQIERITNTEKDFRSIFLRLKKSNIQALGLMLTSGQYALAGKQLQEINWKPELFANNFLESKSEIDAAGSALSGTLIPTNAISPELEEKFEKNFGTSGQLAFGTLAYEFASLLYETLEENKNITTGQDLFQILEGKGKNSSPVGAYRFVNSKTFGKYFEFDLSVREINAGKLRAYKLEQ